MTNLIDEGKLTLSGLREWAMQFPNDEVVGYAASTMYCPVAEYVKSLSDEAVTVSADEAFTLVEGEHYEHPIGVQRVIIGIDDLRDEDDPVTASLLLAIIDGVEE